MEASHNRQGESKFGGRLPAQSVALLGDRASSFCSFIFWRVPIYRDIVCWVGIMLVLSTGCGGQGGDSANRSAMSTQAPAPATSLTAPTPILLVVRGASPLGEIPTASAIGAAGPIELQRVGHPVPDPEVLGRQPWTVLLGFAPPEAKILEVQLKVSRPSGTSTVSHRWRRPPTGPIALELTPSAEGQLTLAAGGLVISRDVLRQRPTVLTGVLEASGPKPTIAGIEVRLPPRFETKSGLVEALGVYDVRRRRFEVRRVTVLPDAEESDASPDSRRSR
jgi:hypothetical protein